MSIVVAAVVVMLALCGVTPASAQQQSPTLSASVSPTGGPAGGTFAINWTLSNEPNGCGVFRYAWAYGEARTETAKSAGSVTVVVPRDAEQGTHSISVSCFSAKSGTRFTVRGTVPTTTTPPVTTTTRPPVTTTRPPVITTRPPVTTMTRPPVTTVPGTTTTTPPVTTTPPTTTDTPPTTPTGPDPGEGDLTLDRDSLQPGEPLSAQGTGCTPESPVSLTSGGETVGATTADAAGDFTAEIVFSRVEPGRHLITAECGIVLTGSVDQLITSSIGGGSTALVVLVFFVLAGAALIRLS